VHGWALRAVVALASSTQNYHGDTHPADIFLDRVDHRNPARAFVY
jgi:hypothetical protein